MKLSKVLDCIVQKDPYSDSFVNPRKKRERIRYFYILDCGHTVVRSAALAGRNAAERSVIKCEWCEEEKLNEKISNGLASSTNRFTTKVECGE
jgi:hypothetical protein